MKEKLDLLGYEITIHNARERLFYGVIKQRCLDIVQYKDDPYFREGDNALTEEQYYDILKRLASETSCLIQAMFFLDMIPDDMPHVFYVDEIVDYYSNR